MTQHNQTFQTTVKLLADILQISEEKIKADSSISNYGDLDSLSFEKLVIAIEDLVGARIETVKLLEIETVQELSDFIEKAKSKK